MDTIAASSGGFIMAQQAAFIHTCAIDNTADHNLLQSNAQPTRQEHITENEKHWPGPYEAPKSELEYENPPNLVNVDYNYMTTKEILEDIGHIPVPLEYLNPTTPVVLGLTQQPTIQQPMQQVADLTTPHPTTNSKATPTFN